MELVAYLGSGEGTWGQVAGVIKQGDWESIIIVGNDFARKFNTEKKFEFIEAVNIYAVEFEKRYKIECVVICDLEKLSVNSQKSIALFRIFQEALSNVVRHAKASRVEVHIQVIKKIFRLEISDNGVGYKSEQKAKPKSFGILGIKERVSMLEGEFDISSSIGKGTKLKIEIPYLN